MVGVLLLAGNGKMAPSLPAIKHGSIFPVRSQRRPVGWETLHCTATAAVCVCLCVWTFQKARNCVAENLLLPLMEAVQRSVSGDEPLHHMEKAGNEKGGVEKNGGGR